MYSVTITELLKIYKVLEEEKLVLNVSFQSVRKLNVLFWLALHL